MSDNQVDINIATVVDDSQLQSLNSELSELENKSIELKIDADSDEAEADLENVRKIWADMSTKDNNITYTYGVEGDDKVFSTMEEAEARRSELDGSSATIDVDVDNNASDKLDEIQEKVDDLDGQSPVIKPEIDNVGVNKGLDEVQGSVEDLTGILGLISGSIAAGGIVAGLDAIASSADSVNQQMNAMQINFDLDSSALSNAKNNINQLNDATGVAKGEIRGLVNQMGLAGVTIVDAATGVIQLASQLSYLKTGSNDAAGSLSQLFAKSIASGKIMERTWTQNGINLDQMAQRAGMTKEAMIDLFASMSPDERANFLSQYAIDVEDAKAANEGLKDSFDSLKDKFDQKIGALGTAFGQMILPLILPVVDAVVGALQWLGDVINGLPDGAKLALGIGILGGALVLIASVIWTSVIPALWGMAAAALANPMVWIALAIVAAIGLIVAAIYEVGKSFGWWTDVSSMLEAIKAGVMRL